MLPLRCFFETKRGTRRDLGRRGKEGNKGNQTIVSHTHLAIGTSRGKNPVSLPHWKFCFESKILSSLELKCGV